jgi:hypothetical protein
MYFFADLEDEVDPHIGKKLFAVLIFLKGIASKLDCHIFVAHLQADLCMYVLNF